MRRMKMRDSRWETLWCVYVYLFFFFYFYFSQHFFFYFCICWICCLTGRGPIFRFIQNGWMIIGLFFHKCFYYSKYNWVFFLSLLLLSHLTELQTNIFKLFHFGRRFSVKMLHFNGIFECKYKNIDDHCHLLDLMNKFWTGTNCFVRKAVFLPLFLLLTTSVYLFVFFFVRNTIF